MAIKNEAATFYAVIPNVFATTEEYEAARKASWDSNARMMETVYKCHRLAEVARNIGNTPMHHISGAN